MARKKSAGRGRGKGKGKIVHLKMTRFVVIETRTGSGTTFRTVERKEAFHKDPCARPGTPADLVGRGL